MTKNKQLTLIAFLVLLFFGCKKDHLGDKYERPSWLAGKLYTQILTQPELSTFAELIKISGYDTIIDVSGSYTVFAPSNEAFTRFFQENPNFKSASAMPKAEVIKLVKYHLVQNQWSKDQLRALDVFGWIDTLDLTRNLPKGYKRETLFRGKNEKYGIQYSKYLKQNSTLKRTNIIDTTTTSWSRRVFTDSRKFSPIFFKEYFDIYNLATSDYEFYFGRQFENMNDIYFCNGRILSDEIFAENGFIYTIDRVAIPLKSGIELLTDKSKPNSYSSYYNLVSQFAEMEYNEQETFKQPGADEGLTVDSLFNLRYPQLVFDINSEKTKPPKGVYDLPSNVTIRYHHGIVAPTNEAFNQLISQYLAGGNNWGSLEAAPEIIKRIVANSCLSINPVYLTDLRKGFLNGESDIMNVDESSIVQKEYGSNCTFIGVNKPIVPRAFSSVTGPVYTRKGYSKIMYAIEKAGLLAALKRKNANYSFYVESDASTSIDSSFSYNGVNFSATTLFPQLRTTFFTNEDLRILLMNHIGVEMPNGIAKREFIKNLAGNYLTINNLTKEVKGTAATTYGFRGTKIVNIVPRKISENADNGTTYEIDNWFNFSGTSLYTVIASSYPKFHALLKKAGLSEDKLSRYSFISDNQIYTAFIPNDSVLNANANYTDAMSLKELKNFCMIHFAQGQMIFTDGKVSAGLFETARIDESSTPFTTINTQIRIVPGIDKITIPSKNGATDIVVTESTKANILTSRNLSTTGTEAFPNTVNNCVVHEIKNVLRYEEVLTK